MRFLGSRFYFGDFSRFRHNVFMSRLLIQIRYEKAICKIRGAGFFSFEKFLRIGTVLFLLLGANCARAVILWSDLGATLVHDTGAGSSFVTGSAMDILGGAVKADDSSSNTLYFKFRVDPLSDASTEEYFAGFELFEGDNERLGVGNSLKAWAYSAFNTSQTGESNKVSGDVDLHSAHPESSGVGSFLPYELPRRGIERTIVFKVQYVPNGDDLVTVWMDPDLSPGATEQSQPENLTTRFRANASFDQVRLRHGGGGAGWTFSDMAIATEFTDLVKGNYLETSRGASHVERSLTFQSWQREQGLPQNSVRALLQTRDGYIWVGSEDGLARFDGMRFVPFDVREGWRSAPVSVLFEDSRGTLWIGTFGGGLTCLRDGHFSAFTIADGLPSDSITALTEDSSGRLWAGTELGLAVFENGRWTTLSGTDEFKGRAITTLFKDMHGNVWLGASGAGVFEFVGGKFVSLTESSADNLLRDPHCILIDQSGRIWIGAGDDYVLCRESGQWRRYRIPRHLARPFVNTLAEEPDGTVWAGSMSEGLFEFKEGKVTAINASGGLLDNFVESLLVDREGNLWVGTSAGLNRLRRSNLSVLGPAEGLGFGPVQGMAEVSPGIIWAGKPGDGIFRWNGRNFQRLESADWSRRFLQVNAILRSHDGSCWIGGARGLLHLTDVTEITNGAEIFLEDLNILSLAEDRSGQVWAGTREGGLWRRAAAKWTQQTNFPENHAVTALLPDASGAIWVGTEGGGLYRYTDSIVAHYDKHNGLLSEFIRALYLDAGNTLWIGTAGGGLNQYRNGKLSASAFTTREGLPDNTISQILEDDAGRLWLGSNRGIACVKKSDLNESAGGKISAIFPRVYGRAEGMSSEECTGGFFPAGLKTQSGLLWFSTLKGIVSADPRPLAASAPAPEVVIEEMLVDGVLWGDANAPRPIAKISPDSQVRLPPGRHRVELHFTGLSFSAPERIRFRYRLEGLDSDWVEAGTRRVAFYSYVPPGHYHFHVIACNSDGVWNQTGANFTLIVMPHLWQSWWFVGLVGLGLLLTVVSIVRLVEKRKLHERLQQLEQERILGRERERIAQDLHDDLGSSLARISLLSGLVKSDKEHPAQVELHAQKISQSADQTVRALEEIVWAVRPGSDTLQSLIDYIAHFANELFDGNTTRCRLDLPPDLPALPLPPDLRHNIFLIVKEALTNALKHSGANEVRLEAKVVNGSLEIAIHDNGRGFQTTAPDDESQHHGLANMKRRAAAMKGALELESAAAGTTIRLRVALPPPVAAN
jgi:ligand-binding sensor domain-containing protein/signal transduction histidine kinase